MKVCDPCSSALYLYDGMTYGRRPVSDPTRRKIGRKEAQDRCIAYWKLAMEKRGKSALGTKCPNVSKGYLTCEELYKGALKDANIKGYGNVVDIFMFYFNKR